MIPAPRLTLEDFEHGEVDAKAFDHEAHVWVAWLCVRRYDRRQAFDRFAAALVRLTSRFGVPEKYHATMTHFWLRLIAERAAVRPGGGWETFRRDNRDLFVDPGALLRQYYSDELLASDEARSRATAPDRVEGSGVEPAPEA